MFCLALKVGRSGNLALSCSSVLVLVSRPVNGRSAVAAFSEKKHARHWPILLQCLSRARPRRYLANSNLDLPSAKLASSANSENPARLSR